MRVQVISDFKLNLTLQVTVKCPLETKGILTDVFSTYDPNLVILAWTGDE